MSDNILIFKVVQQQAKRKTYPLNPLNEATVYYNCFNSKLPIPDSNNPAMSLLKAYTDILNYQVQLLQLTYTVFYKPYTSPYFTFK